MDINKLPKLDSLEAVHYEELMSGWVKFQPTLARVEDPMFCLKLLHLEMHTKRRFFMGKRIIQRYYAIVSKQNQQALEKLWR